MQDQIEKIVYVGFGEYKVSTHAEDVLVALGLGSCVATIAWCPQKKIGGMVHVVLPSSDGKPVIFPGKFADTGIPILVEKMVEAGAIRAKLVVKVVGGAEVFKRIAATTHPGIGKHNIEATFDILSRLRLKTDGEEVGGIRGRTVKLHVGTGKVVVKSMSGEKEI